MNTVPSSQQSDKTAKSGESDFNSSSKAENTYPPAFSGHHVRDLQSQPQSSAETGASQIKRVHAGASVQAESGKRTRIPDYSIATGDHPHLLLATVAPFEPDQEIFILQKHFAALSTITVPHEHFPKSVSNVPLAEQFAENTISWLKLANTGYSERGSVTTTFYDPRNSSLWESTGELTARKALGVFYAHDYLTYELPSLTRSTLLGLHSLPNYFNKGHKSGFLADGQHTPSESLSAYFHGPTIGDCATTLMACLYRAIEATIGTDEFNRIFGSPVAMFRITRSLFYGNAIAAKGLLDTFRHVKPIDCTSPFYYLFEDLRLKKKISRKPLSKLSKLSKELSELDIKKGDILYIQGVDSYCEKHMTGAAMGFNLICTGQNSSGHNLYLGFGPDKFDEPKTYDQVKNILIDGYNKPQSHETVSAIKGGGTSYAQLTNHILPYDHPIVGITSALRFCDWRWENSASLYHKAWHQQPLLPVTLAMESKPVDHGSPFPSENHDADFDHFEPGSSQQELMKLTALKFTHAVINNLGKAQHKKPMGLFLSGSPGIGKTHLCVATAKKAAEYGANTLYIDAAKAGSLFEGLAGDQVQWDRKIDEMLAGKDLVIVDDANCVLGSKRDLLAKIMKYVMTDNKAVIINSNHPIPIKDVIPDIIDPLTENAHNFFYLSDLQDESYRSRWWLSPEVQAADALSKLGQYQGCKAAAVIIEDAASVEEIAQKLRIPVDQIRQVGHCFLPGIQRYSPDYFFRDLTKTKHQAVFMECHITSDESPFRSTKFEQLLNVVQKVHDEGIKLVVKTNSHTLFLEALRTFLEKSIFVRMSNLEPRVSNRLKHMFPDFS